MQKVQKKNTEQKAKLQFKLFDQINKLIPSSLSMVDEIANLLNISYDSAYRRLKGITLLTPDEISLLCCHYKISFDALCENSSNSVIFEYKPILDETYYKEYLNSILFDLKQVENIKNRKLYYAAKDLPLFYDFRFPLLTAFKVFYWMKSIMSFEKYQGIKFDPDVIDPEIINIAQKVFDQYAKIPSIEIWTEVSPVSLMRQIDFFWDSGMFADKKQALDICELIRQELVMIEKQAETGKKFQIDGSPATSENNFMFYWSEIEIGNNCIYVEIEDIKRVYLGYNTFNKLTTQNAYFSQEVENWIKNLIKKSNLLSKVSEKLRHQFFKKLSKNLEIIEARISSE